MITKLKFLCIILFLVGYISACKNESFEEISKSNIKEISAITIDNQIFSVNPIDVEQFVGNPNDIDDEKINRQLLEIAITAREYFRKNSQNEIIMNKSKFSSNKCFNLKELSSINSLKSASKEYLNLISAINKTDLKHKSNNSLKSGIIEEYVPAIHFVNLETADINKRPFICPGFEVKSELTGLEEFEDYIVAWFYDDEDKLHEILINEEMAMATTHPVLVIDNAEAELLNQEKSTSVISEVSILKSTNLWTEIKSLDYQINLRYEGSGNSEFCITAVLIDETGTVMKCLNGGFDLWTEISEVGPSYIGSPLYKWQPICSSDLQPLSSNFIFWNTYERDWFNTTKTLGSATRNGTTIELTGNRKYSDEWYGIDPSQLNSNPLDISYIYNYNSKMYSNSKGHLNFIKYES